ncbi:MAG TPA: Y-family DNA polymerase [Ferruginibacter sp.]|nr:Y-family DNA polymerase [Ferruginibacter sp.]HRE62498.1 Y-family DNA polymerase [Ferruginibacter sp.]
MYAIIDCNNFYCSCERLFLPQLAKQPVVVLSNNDGCIVSRSDEAKSLGVEMAVPYFMAKPLIKKHSVTVFSSNYGLYGDLSWRVMETLRSLFGKKNVEVYSVDEAFVLLEGFTPDQLAGLSMQIRQQVELWTGIKVSVGVAPTKLLAKLANRLAKKNKEKTQCVLLLDTQEKIEAALRQTRVGDLWGVGRQYEKKLNEWAIYDAYQLSRMSESFAKNKLGGVVGVRMIKELRGEPAKQMQDELVQKKMIATTRMFGTPVTRMSELKEAIATYTARAAEKLRRQNSAATTISIFVIKKMADNSINFRGSTHSAYANLPMATSFTQELLKPAMNMVSKIFKEGEVYKKAGVILSGIVPDELVQGNLFVAGDKIGNRKLMQMIDNINFSQRDDILKFAASGTGRNWKMRQELRSPRYTTRWNELCEVK